MTSRDWSAHAALLKSLTCKGYERSIQEGEVASVCQSLQTHAEVVKWVEGHVMPCDGLGWMMFNSRVTTGRWDGVLSDEFLLEAEWFAPGGDGGLPPKSWAIRSSGAGWVATEFTPQRGGDGLLVSESYLGCRGFARLVYQVWWCADGRGVLTPTASFLSGAEITDTGDV